MLLKYFLQNKLVRATLELLIQVFVIILALIAVALFGWAIYCRHKAYNSVPERTIIGKFTYPHDHDVMLMTETEEGNYYYWKGIKVFKIFLLIVVINILIVFVAQEIYQLNIISIT